MRKSRWLNFPFASIHSTQTISSLCQNLHLERLLHSGTRVASDKASSAPQQTILLATMSNVQTPLPPLRGALLNHGMLQTPITSFAVARALRSLPSARRGTRSTRWHVYSPQVPSVFPPRDFSACEIQISAPAACWLPCTASLQQLLVPTMRSSSIIKCWQRM
jgi:hypothetical protein